jgi:hypothetical protein
MPFLRAFEKSGYVELLLINRVFCLTKESWTQLNDSFDAHMSRKEFIPVETVYGHKLKIRSDQVVGYILMSPDGLLEEHEENAEAKRFDFE